MNPLDQAIADLTAEVTAFDTVADSATAFINGVPALIQTAVTAALAAGATPTQLAEISALQAALTAKAATLSAALTANTPAAPTP